MAVVTYGGGPPVSVTSANALRNSSVVLRVQFKDTSDPPVVTDVLNPVATILHAGEAQTVSALGSTPDVGLRYPLTSAGATGLYKLAFLTTGLVAGLYRIVFEGTWVDPDMVPRVLRVEGDFAIGEVSQLDEWIRRVEVALMDDINPQLYRLDEPLPQWSADQIYTHLQASVDRINMFPPQLTYFTFDTVPSDQMVVDGARVYALYARARFEKANELDYSDLHTLNIKRADFYKTLADTLYAQWKEMVVGYKKMTPPTPIGLKSQQIPFRISRVLGLLPNFRTLFSG